MFILTVAMVAIIYVILVTLPLTLKKFELLDRYNDPTLETGGFVMLIIACVVFFIFGFIGNPLVLCNFFCIPMMVLYIVSHIKGEGYLYGFTNKVKEDRK